MYGHVLIVYYIGGIQYKELTTWIDDINGQGHKVKVTEVKVKVWT